MTLGRRRRNGPGDGGFVAGIEVPAAIALLLVPIGLGMLAVAQWPQRQTVARSAAHQAALLAATAPDPTTATQQAEQAARDTAVNGGLKPEDIEVAVTGNLERGGSIIARVTVTMPALAVPGLGTFAPWEWTAVHTERVDDYRSLP